MAAEALQAIAFFRDVNPPGHGGRVLNVSSCGGYAANPTLAYYSAGKFGKWGWEHPRLCIAHDACG